MEVETGELHKFYLEFWGKLVRELPYKKNEFESALLHLGFKWDPEISSKAVIDRYICYPLISPRQIIKRTAAIYSAAGNEQVFETVKSLIDFAAVKLIDDSFIYLEVREGKEGAERSSFDVNLNKSGLRLADIHGFLPALCRYYSIDIEQFTAIYNPLSMRRLSHLAGGVNRKGENFLTIYVE